MNISGHAYKKNTGFTIVELSMVAGIFLLVILILTPFVNAVRERAHRVECAENMMRLSLGLHKYAQEHNNQFPQNMSELFPKYVKDEKAFDCPANSTIGTRLVPDYEYTKSFTEAMPRAIILRDKEGNHGKSGKNMLRVDGAIMWFGSR